MPDDQDKKIKTLADNIIAAMPHKIKNNSYTTSGSPQNNQFLGGESDASQQLNMHNKSGLYRPTLHLLRNTAVSLDDNFNSDANNNAGVSILRTHTSSGYYSSSARSSLSPVSNLAFQFRQKSDADSYLFNQVSDSIASDLSIYFSQLTDFFLSSYIYYKLL